MIFKISLRNLLKQKIISSINVFGLALGFSAFIMVAIFLQFETTWDKTNTAYSRICRVQRHFAKTMYATNGNDISPHTPAITAQLIEKQFPEIEKATVIRDNGIKFLSVNNEKPISNNEGICADSCYFSIFTYKFLEGKQEGCLNEPFTVVLSKTMAQRLFNNRDALNETVILEKKYPLKVTGIYDDLPENSSIRPEYIISFATLAQTNGITRNASWNSDCMTFILLKNDIGFKSFESKIKHALAVHKDFELEELQLCPLKKVYINFNGKNDYVIVLYLYGLIGVFILLMSAFNYINLTIANSASRGKEVALKKVCGSSRFFLIIQFLGETIIVSFIALLLAFEIVRLFLPLYSSIINKPLSLEFSGRWIFFGIIFLISLLVGILSGIYPAIFLSSKSILNLFKGDVFVRGSKISLKHILVTTQFAISAFLVLFTILFSQQIKYMTGKDLGFNKENLLYSSLTISDQEISFDQLRDKILQHPEIEDVSVSKNIPFVSLGGGMTNWEGGEPDEKVTCRFNTVSYDFIKTFGISIIAGRDFSREFQGDIGKSCIINETAVKYFGWPDPIGKHLNDNKLTVVGVVKDYIYKDLHNSIEPVILTLGPDKSTGEWTFAFRVNDPVNAKKILVNEFEEAFPKDPFEFQDLVSSFNNEDGFKTYQSVNRTILFFTVFNIFLAIIGLFGLVSFTVNKRSKEVGIRKISGSTPLNIFFLLSREYLIMLLISLVISYPMVYAGYEKIPSAYKWHAHPWIFIAGAIIMIIVILLTTSYQTLKAARRNPIEALRYE